MSDVDFYLHIAQIKVQGANAISGPLSYGFPALTGFLGAVHALERKIRFPVSLTFDGVLIASHECRIRRYRPHAFSDYTFNQSRNPIRKNGETAAIVEEGKVDMTISLVLPIRCADYDDEDWLNDNEQAFCHWVSQTLQQQRMASGSVFGIKTVELVPAENLDQLKARLAPAFILVDARQELIEITNQLQQQSPDATALDALLETAILHHIPEQRPTRGEDKEPTVHWKTTSVKHGRGWLVPISVGYQSISPLFQPEAMQHSRAPHYPSQYVETLYSLGRWVFPYSLNSLDNAFWRMKTGENGLYLIEQSGN
ncbi:type I-F CRISPR-associated protein Csy2 [Endozoicomonas sp. ALB115]|uniref:type I-F CRISPR-associated protein Csy2 n=1 Tax=Endozoicomonas sp. ALB115 TaxID=3403074 RepID=UPI003BB7CF0A